jgi:flagellar hook-associated protein 2
MATSSNAIFTGTSQFSTDFQNIISRAVTIASLPLTGLQSDKTAMQGQSTALSGLDTKFAALQSAVDGISTAVQGGSFDVTISDPSIVSATTGDGASEGNYSIEVKDIGAYSTSLTSSAWVTAPGAVHTYQLKIGSDSFGITPADNSVQSVASAINATHGDKVRATVVNVGSSQAPDYRISLRGLALGDQPLDILDNSASRQTETVQGRTAQYVVNNSGLTVTSSSRNVQITDGLTVTMLASAPGSPVDVTLVRSTTVLSSALSAFATAYNDTVDAVDAQHGESAGVLSGNSVVYSLSGTLSSLANYTSSGSAVGSLAALGLELGQDGKLTFNGYALMGADLENAPAVSAFLGGASSGFLKAATDALTGVEDPTQGYLKVAESTLKTQMSDMDRQISDKQSQIDAFQTQLQDQMAAADAAIASMEQQYTYITDMFQAMQSASQQYK